jgi:hypothetical protein
MDRARLPLRLKDCNCRLDRGHRPIACNGCAAGWLCLILPVCTAVGRATPDFITCAPEISQDSSLRAQADPTELSHAFSQRKHSAQLARTAIDSDFPVTLFNRFCEPKSETRGSEDDDSGCSCCGFTLAAYAFRSVEESALLSRNRPRNLMEISAAIVGASSKFRRTPNDHTKNSH